MGDGVCLHAHAQGIFAADDVLDDLIPSEVRLSPEVTMEEIRHACSKSKNGKAVGADKISAELLQHLMENDVSAEGVRKWFSDILKSGEVPADWGAAVMVMLPGLASDCHGQFGREAVLQGFAQQDWRGDRTQHPSAMRWTPTSISGLPVRCGKKL